MENQTTNQAADKAMTDFSSANLPENLTLTNVGKEKVLIFEAGETETFSFGKPKSKKGLGMTLTEAIGELEKGYKITCDEAPEGRYCYLNGDKLVNSHSGKWCSLAEFKSEIAPKDKYVWRIYEPKLKHPTQQKRVEQIEKQKCELIAATATIDNQAATIKTFEKACEIKDRTIKKQSDELEKLGETCGNLVRTKLRNEAAIADLTKRNGNLKTITNDQTERIEILQHENKNYESAIAVLEGQNTRLSEICGGYEIQNVEIKESRERLASKFTNWFIFLVIVSVGSIAFNVYQYFSN